MTQTAYQTNSPAGHGRDEELQWARLVETGVAVKGMVVIFLQKMCTAYHEFEPAHQAGALQESALPYFRQRLARRVGAVLAALQANGLEELDGYLELARLQAATAVACSMDELAALAEPIHQANHIVSDALEKI